MSTSRFKKDKEIIADYESQVKGKSLLEIVQDMLVKKKMLIGHKLVHPYLHMSHTRGGCRGFK